MKIAAGGNPAYGERWPLLEVGLRNLGAYEGDERRRQSFQKRIHSLASTTGHDYIKTIQTMSTTDAEGGAAWLQGIVDRAATIGTAAVAGSSD